MRGDGYKLERSGCRRRLSIAGCAGIAALMAALFLASTAFAAGAPAIESESVSNVSGTDATLQAHVNVQETANGAYAQFQLVREASEFAPEILCPEPGRSGEICIGNRSATALPIEYLPANAMHPEAYDVASLDLNAAGVTLTPGTTYHWRLLVAPRVQTEDTTQWEEPTVFGADQTFTTPSEPSSTTQGGNPPSGANGDQVPAGPGHHRRHHRHHRHHHHHGRHR